METNPYLPPLPIATVPDSHESTNEISESELIAFTGKKRYPQALMPLLEGRLHLAGFRGAKLDVRMHDVSTQSKSHTDF